MGDTPDVLKRIVTKKWEEVEHKKSLKSISEMERISEETSYDRRGFVDAIRRCNRLGRVGVIAEIKKASPSKGIIRKHLDPGQIARSYESGGATCLSVLTDEFFFREVIKIFQKLAKRATYLYSEKISFWIHIKFMRLRPSDPTVFY